MYQVQIDEFGGPEVLHLVEVPDPVRGPGQVLIRTAAAGITFVETQVRAGRSPRPVPPPALPLVLGNGVEGDLDGRRVVTATGGFGGYADQVVVDAAEPYAIPDNLELGWAVALLADGRTALSLARAAGITAIDRVLVTAAAGGVGSLLLQLARADGAGEIIAAASTGAKRALARELGADVAVDYAGVTDDLDVVFDGIGGETGRALLARVRPGGRFLAYGAAGGSMITPASAPDQGVTVIPGYTLVRSPEDNRALVEQALAEAAAGRLRPLIGQTFPLSRAADAHAAIEARRTTGKTLLIPD